MAADRAVMIVGPVTWDLFEDGRRTPGGTVCFAARTAAAMGIRAYVLTMAAPDADLSALAEHHVHVVPTSRTLTFAHTFAHGLRTLRVVCAPEHTLTVADAPSTWPPPESLIVAPLLAPDVDPASFADIPAETYGITAQGFLRSSDSDGVVSTARAPTAALERAATARATVFLSEDEVARWPAEAVSTLARRAQRVVITHGDRGAEIRGAHGAREVAALPATAADTTGAGDVFAAAFILALGEGEPTAARLAAAYAAAKVEVVGPAPLPDRSIIERRLASG